MKKQIKSRLLRILCTALSLCMVLALTPTTFATTTEEDGSFSIDFVNDVNDATKATYDTTKNVWAYGTASTGLSVSDGGTSYGLKVSSQAVGNYVTITFKAPATGNYKITYDYYTAAAGGYGDVYVVQYTEDISGIIEGEDGKYISDVCYYNSPDKNGTPITSDGYVSLTQNSEYLVVFAVSQAYNLNGVEKFRMFPTSLTFVPYEPINAVYSFAYNDYAGVASTPEEISYSNSGGRVEFFDIDDASDETWDSLWNSGYACVRLSASGGWVAYKIRVPAAGEYKLTLDYMRTESSTNKKANVYILPASYGVDLTNAKLLFESVDFKSDTAALATLDAEFIADSAGEYLVIFYNSSLSTYVRPAAITLSENGSISGDQGTVGGINDGETNVHVENDEIALTYTANNSVDGTEITPVVSNVESSDELVITIADNTAKAVGAGKATIKADINGYPASWDVTIQNKELVDTFSDVDTDGSVTVGEKASINILTYTTDGTIQNYSDTVEAEFNAETQLTAPDLGDGYTFLYWAKGATNSKQIIPGETCKIYPTVETTYMIAVYAPTGETANKVEFYNYNGQLLDAEIADNKMPALPYMTGYGTADRWAYYGSDETYEEDDDASAFATGTHIFVAQYARLEADIIVTAVNGTANGGSSATVKFGDTVSCVAAGDGTFKWWTKTGDDGKAEIVSLDEEYTFKAWETCTVTAVYGDKAPTYVGETMRIIIDELTVDGTANKAVMAEFVGLDRAVEKGIMLGTKKIAMSGKDSQFTVINDEGATDIKGYAILTDGTLITDN